MTKKIQKKYKKKYKGTLSYPLERLLEHSENEAFRSLVNILRLRQRKGKSEMPSPFSRWTNTWICKFRKSLFWHPYLYFSSLYCSRLTFDIPFLTKLAQQTLLFMRSMTSFWQRKKKLKNLRDFNIIFLISKWRHEPHKLPNSLVKYFKKFFDLQPRKYSDSKTFR